MSRTKKLYQHLAIFVSIAIILSVFIVPATIAQENNTQFENTAIGTTDWMLKSFTPEQRDHILNAGGTPDMAAMPLFAPTETWVDTRNIDGYAGATSVNRGGSIDFHVSTTSPTIDIVVYRMGWYNGAGGKYVFSANNITAGNYPNPTPTGTNYLIEANWPVTYTLNTSASWQTGVYMAKLIANNGEESYITFVVRDDGGTQPIMFVVEVSTWQAYNNFGGKSLYPTQSTNGQRSYEVSFDRPYHAWTGAGYFFEGDYQMLRFLEKENYNVSYATSVDLETNPNLLTGHKMFLSNYHDEYYSWNMRQNITNARNAGINLAFFSANDVYWQIRFKDSTGGTPNRIIVCYKDALLDPMSASGTPQYTTVQFRAAPVNLPENALLGVMWEDLFDTGNEPWVVQNASHWIYTDTGLIDGSIIPGVVGNEYDRRFANGFEPAGLTVLSSSPVPTGLAQASIYTAASGARVFNASTNYWAQQLDDTRYDTENGTIQPAIQQMTRNILNNFTNSTPATPGIKPHYIYDDAVSWEWRNNANSPSAVKFQDSTVVYSGERSIAFTPTATDPGRRISLFNDTVFDTTPYSTLRIVMRSAGPTTKPYNLYFWGPDPNNVLIPDPEYVLAAPPIGSWQVYDIPLTTLTADNKQLQFFWLQSTGAQSTTYIDEIVFLDNRVPTTTGIANVSVNQPAPDTVIDLFAAFADAQTPDSGLTYTVVGNSNPSLFTPLPMNGIDGTAGTLTLKYVGSANGISNMVVRATDPDGLFVEAPFTVTVINTNIPTTTGLANVVVNEDAPDTVIDLFAAFADTVTLDKDLTYSIVSNSNPSLFTATPIAVNASTGTLTLDYAPNANGVANLVVRATDTTVPVGLFVNTPLSVTVNPVNDAPSFSNLGNVSVAYGAPASQTIVGWAKSFVFGPANESTQGVADFIVTVTSNPDNIFVIPPDIDNTGKLTFTHNSTPGTATISVQMQDTGGVAHAGVDVSIVQNLTITITLTGLPPSGAPNINYYTSKTVTLSWNRVSWATGYEIQIDDSSAFTAPIVFDDATLSADTLYITTTVPANGYYYWRLRAKKPDGAWGSWSSDQFTVNAP